MNAYPPAFNTLPGTEGTYHDDLRIAWELADIADSITMDRFEAENLRVCLLYTSPSPRDKRQSRMPSSA